MPRSPCTTSRARPSTTSPRISHRLKPASADYQQGRSSREAFLGKAYWTGEYVGAGPYRLDHWEPGVQLEGTAFDGHSLGRANIDRIVVRIAVDENTTLAGVLS